MGVLSITVRVGQAVQIGEVAVIKVQEKSGRQVKLGIAALDSISPIKLLPTGIIPARFAVGLGEGAHPASPQMRAIA